VERAAIDTLGHTLGAAVFDYDPAAGSTAAAEQSRPAAAVALGWGARLDPALGRAALSLVPHVHRVELRAAVLEQLASWWWDAPAVDMPRAALLELVDRLPTGEWGLPRKGACLLHVVGLALAGPGEHHAHARELLERAAGIIGIAPRGDALRRAVSPLVDNGTVAEAARLAVRGCHAALAGVVACERYQTRRAIRAWLVERWPPPAHDSPVDDSPAHDSPAHDSPAHDSPAHDSPAHDSPAHDSPAHDSPAHDSPAHDSLAAVAAWYRQTVLARYLAAREAQAAAVRALPAPGAALAASLAFAAGDEPRASGDPTLLASLELDALRDLEAQAYLATTGQPALLEVYDEARGNLLARMATETTTALDHMDRLLASLEAGEPPPPPPPAELDGLAPLACEPLTAAGLVEAGFSPLLAERLAAPCRWLLAAMVRWLDRHGLIDAVPPATDVAQLVGALIDAGLPARLAATMLRLAGPEDAARCLAPVLDDHLADAARLERVLRARALELRANGRSVSTLADVLLAVAPAVTVAHAVSAAVELTPQDPWPAARCPRPIRPGCGACSGAPSSCVTTAAIWPTSSPAPTRRPRCSPSRRATWSPAARRARSVICPSRSGSPGSSSLYRVGWPRPRTFPRRVPWLPWCTAPPPRRTGSTSTRLRRGSTARACAAPPGICSPGCARAWCTAP
jgi:hypothetical protein